MKIEFYITEKETKDLIETLENKIFFSLNDNPILIKKIIYILKEHLDIEQNKQKRLPKY